MAKEREDLIELRHLRYFIALSEELHFARAAERLGMEQSPLSRAIREMERMLGVRLFERNTRSTRITRAGTVLLEYAKRSIALVEQASTSARSAALGHSNRLRIGVSDCTAYARMMEILVRYRTANPDVTISLHEMPLHRQISGIRDDLVDASISLDGSNRDGIEVQAVSRDVMCVAVSAAHPLVHTESILPTDLARYPLILFSAEADLGAGSQIDNFVDDFPGDYKLQQNLLLAGLIDAELSDLLGRTVTSKDKPAVHRAVSELLTADGASTHLSPAGAYRMNEYASGGLDVLFERMIDKPRRLETFVRAYAKLLAALEAERSASEATFDAE